MVERIVVLGSRGGPGVIKLELVLFHLFLLELSHSNSPKKKALVCLLVLSV